MTDERFYLDATTEVDEGRLNRALWAKALALCDGDETRARYYYIRERALQLCDFEDADEDGVQGKSEVEGAESPQDNTDRTPAAANPGFQEGLTEEERIQAGVHDVRHIGESYLFCQYEYDRFADALSYAIVVSTHQHTLTESPAGAPKVKPWGRYFGRLIDFAWFALVATAGLTALWPVAITSWRASPYYATYSMAVVLAWVFVEPIFLSAFGATPGKWLMGIKLRPTGAWKAGYGTYFERSFRVYAQGLFLGLPVLSLVAMVLAYLRLRKHRVTTWDEALGIVVIHESLPPLRLLLAIFAFLGAIAIFVRGYMGI